MLLGIAVVLAFTSGLIIAWAAWPNQSSQAVRKRLNTEFRTSKVPAFVTNLATAMAPIHRKLPLGRYTEWVARMQEEVGVRVAPFEFLMTQEFGALAGLMFFLVTRRPGPPNLLMLLVFVGGGVFLPILSLQRRIKARRSSVARDLPEVVDLLTLSVGAGTDLIGGLTHIVKEFRPCPVIEELGVLLSEIRVGKRRRDALRAFAKRLQTPEASTFSRTLIQADRMGTGLVGALKVLFEDMRLQRYHWAERFAQQAPLKMLVPLMLSLASALLIVTGPIFIQFFRGGLMGGAGGLGAKGGGAMQAK